MRAAGLIAIKDLRQRLRDRSALIISVFVPLGLSFILASSLGGVDERIVDRPYGLVDLDRGEVAAAFPALLARFGFDNVRTLSTRDDALREAGADRIAAAWVLPRGFSRAAFGSQPAAIAVIGSPDAPIGTQIARAVADGFANELNALRLSVAAALPPGVFPRDETIRALVERARSTPASAVLSERPVGSRTFTTDTFFAAGMAVFFAFFAVEFGTRSLLQERQNGTLPRLLAGPVRPGSILAGKAMASFVIGLTSMSALVVATTYLLDAEWGRIGGVVVMILASVTAAVGITMLVTTLARTPEQASGYAGITAMFLGLLGGSFFPISQGGEVLSRLTLVTPHAWLMRGLGELSGGAGVPEILPEAGIAMLFGFIPGAIGLVRARTLIGGS